MDKTRKLLARAAQKLELPPDIFAGLPRMELSGAEEFSLEPHSGLMEYSKERVTLMTAIGAVSVLGKDLVIRQMNGSRIVLSGSMSQIILPEA